MRIRHNAVAISGSLETNEDITSTNGTVSAKTGYFNEVDVSNGTVSAKKGSFSGASFGNRLGLSSQAS